MAIFSLHHTPIGKSTQAQPHTAAAHVRYITRRDAMSHIETARLPARPGKAMKYLRNAEDNDRANARVADKVMLALPRELNAQQRIALVRDFAEEATRGRAPWLAAFHDKGDDRRNPHCHLVIRDRDPKTGRRVIGMSEAGSTDMLRRLWELHANRALKAAGRPERIDRRSLAAQGIERAPTIHEGPRAREMDARGAAPRSKAINARNGRGARLRARRVDYHRIDGGMSRPAYNRAIRESQKEAEYWAAIDADTRRRDFEALGYSAERASSSEPATRPEVQDAKSKKRSLSFIQKSGNAKPSPTARGERELKKGRASFSDRMNEHDEAKDRERALSRQPESTVANKPLARQYPSFSERKTAEVPLQRKAPDQAQARSEGRAGNGAGHRYPSFSERISRKETATGPILKLDHAGASGDRELDRRKILERNRTRGR